MYLWETSPPPHIIPPPPPIWTVFNWYILRMASNLEVMSMTADIGQQQWSRTFFRLSDRTLIGRVKNFVIWQELVEFQAEAWLWLPRGFEPFLRMAVRYKQPVQYRKGPPIKAGQPEPSPHLETACKIHDIYEDLNESSSARPGRVSSWRFHRA